MNNRKKIASAAALATFLAAAFPAAAQDVPPSHVANPDIYKVIAQDERYIAMEVTWKAGQKDNMHSHPKGLVVHFLTDCHGRTTTRDGKTNESKRKAGETLTVGPVVAHTFENLGKADCKHLHVEAK
jgi:beta-alanine degradation protein BauB